MTSRQTCDAHGRFCSSAASTSRNPPGGFPNIIQPIPHIAGPPSNNKVQGLLTDTVAHDVIELMDSPICKAPEQRVETLSQEEPPQEGYALTQPPTTESFCTSTPHLQPASNHLILSCPLSPSHLLNPIHPHTPSQPSVLLTRYAPPLGPPPPPIFVPAPTLPPAPAGIDPVLWAHNQVLILSLLPILQVLHPTPTPAPAPTQLLPKEGDTKAPTTFSGDDPTKLQDFLFECGLIFNTKPCMYATEKSCVLYTIQHLDGVAKHHFWCYIENGSTDAKVNQWAAFAQELKDIFGDTDHIGRASDKILSLAMKESSRMHCYTVTFKEAANELGWSDDVLHRLYYNGLPDRIKDLWQKSDLPASLNNPIQEAQHADTWYWKCSEERKKPQLTSDNRSQLKPSTSTSQHSRPKPATPNSQSHTSASAQSSSTPAS